jgi:poly-gamma-glutamate synthesis protein (capsule biosynthesis protein)
VGVIARSTRVLLVGVLLGALVLVLGLVALLRDDTDVASVDGGDRDQAAPAASTEFDPDAAANEPGATLDADRPLRSFTLAATGDFLIHMPVQRRAAANAGGTGYSFTPMLTDVTPIISAADLALCHMETPVSADDTGLSGYPVFNVPREIATAAAAAGYDGCSTASNHSIDKGAAGVTSTLDVLDGVGLKHAGTARSALEAVTPTVFDVQGVKVAHLSFAYGTNGIPIPAATPWLVNLIDPAKILADAHAARDAGAEFVVVSLQWGNEYQSAPTPDQQALAAQLLSSPDVDLIVGSHVHVVQPIQRLGEKYVAYGVGNLLSNQGAPNTPTPSQDGMILQVFVTEQSDGTFRATKVDYTPTWVDRSTYLVTLATPASNAASYERTVSAVTSLGPLAYQGEPIFGPIPTSPTPEERDDQTTP